MTKLHSFPISPNGKRVNICAAEVGATLDQVEVNFSKGDNRSPEYLAMNPMGKAPTLHDGEFVLWESAAILCYLAQTNADGKLWPKDPRAVADTLRWMFFGSCHLDPYFTTFMVERFIKPRRGAQPDEERVRVAEEWVGRFVAILDGHLSTHEYVTRQFGLGDIVLGCTLELSPLVKYDLAPYPNVRRWLERLQSRDSWRSASPPMG